MEIYERINILLIEQNMSKREFANKLIDLKPISNRTGEVISESIIYSYLSGATAIKAYLIPYISEVLNVSIDTLFNDNNVVICNKNNLIKKQIIELINYAPDCILIKILNVLKEIKRIHDNF
jgi:transcriptional regulator with XRE-family HTH domain